MSIAFWSVKLTNDSPAEVQPPEGYVLNVQTAALTDAKNANGSQVIKIKTVAVEGGELEAVIGTLRPKTSEQISMNMCLGFDVPATFSIAGDAKGTVYLSGYYQPGPDMDSDGDDEESDEEEDDEEDDQALEALKAKINAKMNEKIPAKDKIVVEGDDDDDESDDDDDDGEDEVDAEFIKKMMAKKAAETAAGEDDDEDEDEDSSEEEEAPPVKVQKVAPKGVITPSQKSKPQQQQQKPKTPQSGNKPNQQQKQKTPQGQQKQNFGSGNKGNKSGDKRKR